MERVKDNSASVTHHAAISVHSTVQQTERAREVHHSPLTREDVLVGALSCLCRGDAGRARELLGNS
jgi:hypothetical protein